MHSSLPSSLRERNLAIFERRDPGGVLWQPRLEFWYRVNAQLGTLPDPLRGASLMDVYDYCHASVRYSGSGLRTRYRKASYREEWEDETTLRRIWETPLGTLTDIRGYDEHKTTAHNAEYKIKRIEDFEVLEYLLQDEEWYWDEAAYQQSVTTVGDRGAPQFYPRRSPIQQLFIRDVGFERAIYMMYDHPDVIQRYVEVATAADDAMYQVICRCPVRIVNLGENIDVHMDPPQIWREHLLPHYRRRTEQLHAAEKFVHIHIDGSMKPLLPHLQDCPWDGIEAATPIPQGDVTLEELKDAFGDLILLDGIPALYFLPIYPERDLTDCVEKLVDLFYPNLVLGISDEIPPIGDIERVRLVGEMVRNLI